MSLLLFLLAFSGIAFSGPGPAAEPATPSELDALRADYAAELDAERARLVDTQKAAQVHVDDATALCVTARNEYETIRPLLKDIGDELAALPSATYDATANHRANLIARKTALEETVISAERKASTAGAELVKAKVELAKVTKEIAKIDEEINRVACASSSPPSACSPYHNFFGRTYPVDARGPYSLVTLSPPWHGCYPDEAPSQTAVDTFGHPKP